MSIKLSSPARRPGHKRGASEVSKFLQLLKPDKHRKSKSEESVFYKSFYCKRSDLFTLQ